MTNFGSKLGKNVSKIKNTHGARPAKAEIRRNVLDAVPSPAVFDAFAGRGEMYHDVWVGADRYAGCDKEWHPDERKAWVADNRRVMRCIDLSAYNIFDLDAYGSPWEQAIILSERRLVAAGEMIGVVLTEGSGMKMKQGGLPKGLQVVAGLRDRVAGTAALADEIVDRAIEGLAKRMACRVVGRWQAKGKVGSRMLYIGLVLQGHVAPEPTVE